MRVILIIFLSSRDTGSGAIFVDLKLEYNKSIIQYFIYVAGRGVSHIAIKLRDAREVRNCIAIEISENLERN